MSTRPHPKHTKPVSVKPPKLSRQDAALIARLERAGVIVSGPDAGKPLDEDDELLRPGPACPGAVEAVIESR